MAEDTQAPSAGVARAVAGVLALAVFGLASCETQREATSSVKSSYSFDGSFWGGQTKDDRDKMKERFADSGWKVDEDGNIRPTKAENADLYRKNKFDPGGKDQEKREAKLSKRDTEKEYFKTPEYLKRQQYEKKSADNRWALGAREGEFDQNRAGESGADAATESGRDAGIFGLFKTRETSDRGKSFATKNDRIGTRAQADAAVATGVSQGDVGFYRENVRTMDDVKKLLHPEAFD
ncbi:MAG: hypothetical protein KDM91_11930 [Verrucomicrobiae bacterium]|nr:hypothetical protein [Verrucomicrobiae bacterium]MCP5539248.1 hypothetical protein [Akkermansiaceae bacterium]